MRSMPHVEPVDEQMQQLSLGADGPAPETPESLRFRSLPQDMQRRLLLEYPRILATAMHRYSEGDNCEDILLKAFEDSSEMLRVHNSDGDNPMASALARQQGERAEKLVDIAVKRNPDALDDRTRHRESLLMLSTQSGSSADSLMERLLIREPTQLHRLYDNDGRNFLHHCALEESTEVLVSGLRVTRRLIEEGRLAAGQVSAAIHMNDRAGDTVLHMMAARDREDMLSPLLQFARDAGISVNLDERQHRGKRWTPLMSAVSAGAARAVRFLLDSGADPLEEDSDGVTAEELAADRPELKELLESEHSEDMEIAEAEEDNPDSSCDAVPPMVKAESWLTNSELAQVRYIDSGVSSLFASAPSVASAEPQRGSELSEMDLASLEDQLLSTGKTSAFFSALLRILDDRLSDHTGLATLSERPLRAALSIWGAHGHHVSRETLLQAFKEVKEGR
ncbi:hypothetical protein BOX15_Mlig014147g1 [Macrostomum lignano]|uniref:Uncharacterized protein n=1 Tax=Macrostomum lignano TaxID=282301 RepID=A0A267EXC7_9PLAT|nr:hypothetical protein BOX15_Mlig014147g1 [Macrostomum lignano]